MGDTGRELTQIAFVAPDVRSAISHQVRALGTGPWFVLERFTLAHAVYRGRRVAPVLSVAFAFRGDTMLELIQQHDDQPSVFTPGGAPALHHIGLATTAYDAALAARGTPIFSAETSGRMAFFQPEGVPYLVEILELTERRRQIFDRIHAACRGWDGSEAVRTFPA